MKAWFSEHEVFSREEEQTLHWLQGQRRSIAAPAGSRNRLKRAALARLAARPRPRRQPASLGLRLAGAALVFLLLFSSAGVVSAAASSLPGDSLYALKTMLEDWRLAMAATPEIEADILAGIIQTRLAELAQLEDSDDSQGLVAGLARLLANLESAESLPATPALTDSVGNSRAALTQVLERVPPQAQAAIRAALANQGDPPSVVPPPSASPTAVPFTPTQMASLAPSETVTVIASSPTGYPVVQATVTPRPTREPRDDRPNPTQAANPPGGGPPITPPGQGGENPGQGHDPDFIPPGQGGENPGQGDDSDFVPPGQENTPAGQGTPQSGSTPPGQQQPKNGKNNAP